MKVPIYRMFVPIADCCWPVPAYSFEAEDDFPSMMPPGCEVFAGLAGTGSEPWVIIDVPDGSRLERCPVELEEGVMFEEFMLLLPDGEMLDPTDAFKRYGDPALVRSEEEIIKQSLDSASVDPSAN